MVLVLSGCALPGDPEIIGYSGVTRGDDGRLIAEVLVCSGTVRFAQLKTGGYTDNVRVMSWTASKPASGYIRLDPQATPDGWTLDPGSRTTLEPDGVYIFTAAASTRRTTGTVSFTTDALNQLEVGRVRVFDDGRYVSLTEAEFARLCEEQ